jgi:hypothetical protein
MTRTITKEKKKKKEKKMASKNGLLLEFLDD